VFGLWVELKSSLFIITHFNLIVSSILEMSSKNSKIRKIDCENRVFNNE
jgi:hypothetical protein